MSLGGILLCITGGRDVHTLYTCHLSNRLIFLSNSNCFGISGSEAMFADLGHFSQLSIQVHRLGNLVQ